MKLTFTFFHTSKRERITETSMFSFLFAFLPKEMEDKIAFLSTTERNQKKLKKQLNTQIPEIAEFINSDTYDEYAEEWVNIVAAVDGKHHMESNLIVSTLSFNSNWDVRDEEGRPIAPDGLVYPEVSASEIAQRHAHYIGDCCEEEVCFLCFGGKH